MPRSADDASDATKLLVSLAGSTNYKVLLLLSVMPLLNLILSSSTAVERYWRRRRMLVKTLRMRLYHL